MRAIVAGLIVSLAAVATCNSANAAILAWGCQGQLGGQQVIFNRYSMIVLDSKGKLGDLHKLPREQIELPAGSPPGVAYNPVGDTELTKVMEFARADDAKRKLTLTEKSSRLLSHRHKLVCGRDDDTDIYRKVYTYQREDEPPRTITMQCIWYQLSTRGGRKGCGAD